MKGTHTPNPIVLTQTDHLNGPDIDVTTTLSLFQDGRIVTQTHTHEETDLKGGHAGPVVLLYGTASDGPAIWNTIPQSYGVDGSWVGRSDRDDTYQASVDPDTMSQVGHAAIKHYSAPNSAIVDIQNWLTPAQSLMSAAGAIVKLVGSF